MVSVDSLKMGLVTLKMKVIRRLDLSASSIGKREGRRLPVKLYKNS